MEQKTPQFEILSQKDGQPQVRRLKDNIIYQTGIYYREYREDIPLDEFMGITIQEFSSDQVHFIYKFVTIDSDNTRHEQEFTTEANDFPWESDLIKAYNNWPGVLHQ